MDQRSVKVRNEEGRSEKIKRNSNYSLTYAYLGTYKP